MPQHLDDASICSECGVTATWGGMRWQRHTSQFHEAMRRRLLLQALYGLWELRGIRRGHRITLYFNAASAWTTCACGWMAEEIHPSSGQALWLGRFHVRMEGRN